MDNNLQDMIAKAVVDIIKQKEDNKGIKVGVSARHVHLSQEHLEILFGKGHELTVKKMLMGDQFAAEECVTLVSPSLRTIEGVRVLGPVRKQSQVEISRTDTFKLKVSPPVRPSGELKGSAPMAPFFAKRRVALVGTFVAFHSFAFDMTGVVTPIARSHTSGTRLRLTSTVRARM